MIDITRLTQYLPKVTPLELSPIYPARRVALQILYESTDISVDLAQYLISASYKDVMSGEADTFDLTLDDRQGLWSGDWYPSKNAQITVNLILIHWYYDIITDINIPLGKFYIDDIGIALGNSGATVQLNTVSVPDGVARDIQNTRSWEKVQLNVVAQDLANSAKLGLVYDSEDNPTLDRVEQTEEADLVFLERLCKDNGLCTKVSDGKIVIFDEAKYDTQDPITTIDKLVLEDIEDYEFHSKVREIYTACTVTYQKSKKKEKISATFEAPEQNNKLKGTTEQKVLKINQEVADTAAALRLAKKELFNKNKEETTGKITLKGRPDLYAGACIMLINFGAFDGKYVIKEVDVELSGNYVTSLDLRRALVGYN